MRGGKHPSLVSPVESKKIVRVRVRAGPLSEPGPQPISRPGEARGKYLPSLYLIALGFGRRTPPGAWAICGAASRRVAASSHARAICKKIWRSLSVRAVRAQSKHSSALARSFSTEDTTHAPIAALLGPK